MWGQVWTRFCSNVRYPMLKRGCVMTSDPAVLLPGFVINLNFLSADSAFLPCATKFHTLELHLVS